IRREGEAPAERTRQEPCPPNKQTWDSRSTSSDRTHHRHQLGPVPGRRSHGGKATKECVSASVQAVKDSLLPAGGSCVTRDRADRRKSVSPRRPRGIASPSSVREWRAARRPGTEIALRPSNGP